MWPADEFLECPDLKRFTREEARRLSEAGIPEGRWELIEGVFVDKNGYSPFHGSVMHDIYRRLSDVFAPMQLRIRCPIEVAPEDQHWSEPEPDIAVLVENKPEYAERHPRGDETLLCVEVAPCQPQHFLDIKAPIYARAGVPELWILDLVNRFFYIHRSPGARGYGRITRLGESLSVTIGNITIPISGLLPKQESATIVA